MKKILKIIVSYPKLVFLGSLLFCVFLSSFANRLEIDASTQTLLLENDKELSIWREVSKQYQTPNFLLIAYTPKGDLLSQDTLNELSNLTKELEKINGIKGVFSILNAPLLNNKKQSFSSLLEKIPTLQDKDINLSAAKNEFLSNPLYKDALVSSDFKTTSVLLYLDEYKDYNELNLQKEYLMDLQKSGQISAEEKLKLKNILNDLKIRKNEIRELESQNIKDIKATLAKFSKNSDSKLFLGGLNMIANDMIDYVRGDLSTYGISVLVLLVFCLWLFFGQLRFILLPIFICVLSAGSACGLFGFFGYEVTVISSNFIALQLIITVSLVIHLVVGYREFYFLHPNYKQKTLVYLALISRKRPCFFAIFTTIIGFASLIFSQIKPIISLGLMMSVSVALSLVIGFVVFGSVMSFLPKITPKCKFENNFKFTQICANLAIKHRFLILFVSGLVLVFGLFGVGKLKVENSFIGYFKKNTDIYKGMEVIDTKLGGTIPFDVVVKFDPQTQEQNKQISDEFDEFESEFTSSANDPKYWFGDYKLNIIKKIDKFLQDNEFIGNVSSLATLLEIGKSLNDNKDLDSLSLAVIYENLNDEYKSLLLNPYISIEKNEAHFSVRTIDSDPRLRRNEFLQNLRKNLDELLKDDNAKAQVSGIMVLYNTMLQSLISSQINTLAIVLSALFVTFIFVFKSTKFAILALVANIIPLVGVFGIMGFCGINLDIMSITVAAISLGIGVDNIIHYIHRYKIERRTKSIKASIMASHTSVGYAMYYTSFSIFLGFSVMTTSNFWPTIYFGLLTDLVMALMLLSALLLLPAMIILLGKFDFKRNLAKF